MRLSCSVLSIALSCAAFAATAQDNQPIVGSSVKAKTLSGIVRGPSGLSLPGVAVTLFDCGDGTFQGKPHPHADAETKSDGKGKFDLKWPMLPRVCLQFQAPGMNTMQMEVLRAQDGGKLDVTLVPGT